MQTRYKLVTGAAALTLAGGAAVAVPNLAQAETSTPSTSQSTTATTSADRTSPMKASLDKLVKAGTITQAQADKILSQVEADRPQPGDGPRGAGGQGPGAHGPGARGHHAGPKELAAAAKTLDLTEEQLRTKLQTQSLGEIADAQKVSRQTLTDALQKAMTSDAATRAQEMLDLKLDQRGPGHERDGRGAQGQQQGPRDQQGQQGQQQGPRDQQGQQGQQQGPGTTAPSAGSSASASNSSFDAAV